MIQSVSFSMWPSAFLRKGARRCFCPRHHQRSRRELGSSQLSFRIQGHSDPRDLRRIARPLQSRRLARLDKVEAEAGGGRLDLESVLRALIEPTVQEGLKSEGSLNFLPRLMFQAYAVSRPFLDDSLAEENDRTALRFLDALSRSVPEMPYEQICLRYYAIIGGLLQLITDAQGARRIERLSQGRCSGANPNLITEELVALYKGGFSATQ